MTFSSLHKLIAGLSFFVCSTAFAAPLVVDVTGVESIGELGDTENTVLSYNVGANARITGVSYSINLTAFDPSWLAELGLAFTDSDSLEGVIVNPGFFDTDPGTASYTDAVNLVDLGLDFNVGSDGILRLEFYEDFDDFPGVDGIWNFGTITFEVEPVAAVPEPSTALLFGAGVVMLGYGRRRRTVAASRGTIVQ